MSSKRKWYAASLAGLSFAVVLLIAVPMVILHIADPSIGNPYADRMHGACGSGDTKAVEAMIKQGADVNRPVWEDVTALMYACTGGHLDTVKVLLAAGADVNQQSTHGDAYSWANNSNKDAKKILALLKQAGAKD